MKQIAFGALIALAALCVALAATPRVYANDEAASADADRLSHLKISVWPEYDKPSVLVMYDGTLADASNLPHAISTLIPSHASLTVTTWANADGSYAPEQPFQKTDLGDGYARVTFTVSTAQFHLEYYDDLLRGTPDKSMDFAFKAQSAVDQAEIDIQQPAQATNFTLNPPAQSSHVDNGFNTYVLQYSNVAAGQILTSQVKYTKTDPHPSVLPTSAPASAPAASAPASISGTTVASPSGTWNTVFIIVAAFTVGLVALLGLYLWQQRSRQLRPATGSASRGPAQSHRRRGKRPGMSETTVFCTHCGRPLEAEDNFCPKCGTERRVS